MLRLQVSLLVLSVALAILSNRERRVARNTAVKPEERCATFRLRTAATSHPTLAARATTDATVASIDGVFLVPQQSALDVHVFEAEGVLSADQCGQGADLE